MDDDPRAVYFKQAQYGVYVRMALILTLLGLADSQTVTEIHMPPIRRTEEIAADVNILFARRRIGE